jgi:PAS domain S-box-containing protein
MAGDLSHPLASSPAVRRHLAMPNTGVYIVRHDGHIVWASPSMATVTGRTPEELVGGNGWNIFVRPEDIPEVARFKAALTASDGILWMPDRKPGTEGPRWYRIDTWVESDHILCAFRAERDASEHHLHYVLRPRPNPPRTPR